jgi:hypothetical protein
VRAVSWCDSIVVVDGAWKGYPTRTPYSTDGTLEVLKDLQRELDNLVVYSYKKFTEGYTKIDKYRSIVPGGDYIIRLNGDEIVYGEDKLLRRYIEDTKELPVYAIPLYNVLRDGSVKETANYIPRIIRNLKRIKFTGKNIILTNDLHNYAIGSFGRLVPLQANIDFLEIQHMKQLRPASRRQNDFEWVKYYNQYLKGKFP